MPFAAHLPNPAAPKPLRGVRVLSLALNLPGPAALARLRAMGARCGQVLPPTGDPMAQYCGVAYRDMKAGVRCISLDLKTAAGQRRLHASLAKTDVLLTSFRPAALKKLGLNAPILKRRYPTLSAVAIVGAAGAQAQNPGHDLTYQAEAGLIQGLHMPSSLLADMTGALLVSEAVLQAVVQQQRTGQGIHCQVALVAAAQWLTWPLQWGLAGPGQLLGGQHAGYRVYACQDGRVVLAALEPHFAAALGQMLGLGALAPAAYTQPALHKAVAQFMGQHTCAQLQQLALTHDLPLHTLPASSVSALG